MLAKSRLHSDLLSVRMIAPAILTLLLVAIGATNTHIAGLSSFFPLLIVMSVFYWTAYWPALMPKWFVLVSGLFHDIIYGLPIGVMSVSLLIIWGILVSQRRLLVKEPFIIIWPAFAICLGIVVLVNWLLYSLYLGEIVYSEAIVIQLLLSIAVYPCLHKLFNIVHKMLLKV